MNSDSDSDEDIVLNDNDNINNNNNNVANNNVANNNVVNNDVLIKIKQKNNPDNQNELSEKKKEFDGSTSPKNGWIFCVYCGKNHPPIMHLPDISYCGHCWGWLNSDQLKLSEGIYNGPNTIHEIKQFLKLTYPLHPTTCKNNECIYNMIKKQAELNTLHIDFSVLLGFVSLNPKKNDDDKKKSDCVIKKKNPKINYKLSSISI